MGDFKGKKIRLVGTGDTGQGPVEVPTCEYVTWLEGQLNAARNTAASLRKRLDQYIQMESRRMMHEQDYVPYADDRYD